MPVPAEPPERVDVEHHQGQRKHHDARLRDEREDVDTDRSREQRLATFPGRVEGLEVHQDREEEEQPREHVAPLGGPGYRFDAQGVDGEEERRRDRGQA